jgi:hypothetical protein
MQGHFIHNGGGKSGATRRFSVSTVPTLSCNLFLGAAAAGLTKRKCHGADVIPKGRGLRVWLRSDVIAGHEHQIATRHLGRQDHGSRDARPRCPGGCPEGNPGRRPRQAEAWSLRMEGYGGPAQPSPTIGQCLSGGLGWLEVECNRCKTRASLPLDAIRRPRETPLWRLEALKCRSCRKGRHAPPVHMIKLTETREITPYVGAPG